MRPSIDARSADCIAARCQVRGSESCARATHARPNHVVGDSFGTAALSDNGLLLWNAGVQAIADVRDKAAGLAVADTEDIGLYVWIAIASALRKSGALLVLRRRRRGCSREKFQGARHHKRARAHSYRFSPQLTGRDGAGLSSARRAAIRDGRNLRGFTTFSSSAADAQSMKDGEGLSRWRQCRCVGPRCACSRSGPATLSPSVQCDEIDA